MQTPKRPTKLTDNTACVLINYIRNTMDVMGLKDWQFDLSNKPAPSGRIAQVEVWGDSMTATFWLGSFFDYGPRMQREIIVHEIVHCHTDKMFKRAREVMRKTLGREAFEVALDSFEQVHELTVDAIASAWARMLPLIDWNDKTPLYTAYEKAEDADEADRKDSVVI